MTKRELIQRLKSVARKDASEKDISALADSILAANKNNQDPTPPPGGGRADGKIVGGAIDYLGKTLEAVKGPVEDILNPFESVIQRVKEFRAQNEAFAQSGFTGEYAKMKETMKEVANESLRLTGNFKAFREVQQSFRENFKGLAFVTEGYRKTIMKTGVAMQAAGFDMDTFANIVDSSVFAFGENQAKIESISATLIKTSRDFQIAPRELARNFEFAQKNFSYSSEKFMSNFLKLQAMSRKTGISFQGLASSFGQNMDSFESSAQMAGRLNQILGKSMFNSIDLLGKTTAERAEIIRKGIRDRFGARANNLQKFELISIAKSLNMSPDEARRFLQGKKDFDPDMQKKLDAKDPMKMANAKFETEVGNLEKSIRNFRLPFERGMLDLSFKSRDAAKNILKLDQVAEQIGIIGGNLIGERTAVPGDQTGAIKQMDTKDALAAILLAGGLGKVSGALGAKILAGRGLQKSGILPENVQKLLKQGLNMATISVLAESLKDIQQPAKTSKADFEIRGGTSAPPAPPGPLTKAAPIEFAPTTLAAITKAQSRPINIYIDGKKISEEIIMT